MASVASRCLGQDNFTLENVCRLCLFTNFPMRNIFRTQVAFGDEIYKVLNYLFGLEITVNDQLPPNICRPCVCKITAYFAFKRNALLAKSELIEIVDLLRIVVPREETENADMCNREATIEEKQLTSEEIEIVEWNTPKDLITERDSMHVNETELIEGQKFLSTESEQPTECTTRHRGKPCYIGNVSTLLIARNVSWKLTAGWFVCCDVIF